MSNKHPVASFKPGQSGNPNGRPPLAWTWRGEILKALERVTPDGIPMKQGVAEALLDKALQGDVLAIKEIGNRMDGMPKQFTDITSAGKPIPLLGGATNEISDNGSD